MIVSASCDIIYKMICTGIIAVVETLPHHILALLYTMWLGFRPWVIFTKSEKKNFLFLFFIVAGNFKKFQVSIGGNITI